MAVQGGGGQEIYDTQTYQHLVLCVGVSRQVAALTLISALSVRCVCVCAIYSRLTNSIAHPTQKLLVNCAVLPEVTHTHTHKRTQTCSCNGDTPFSTDIRLSQPVRPPASRLPSVPSFLPSRRPSTLQDASGSTAALTSGGKSHLLVVQLSTLPLCVCFFLPFMSIR